MLEVSTCLALCYMLFKNNRINYHASLMKQTLSSHFTAGQLRLLDGQWPVRDFKIILPENHTTRFKRRLVLLWNSTLNYCYTPLWFNHFSTLCKHQNPLLTEIRCEAVTLGSLFLCQSCPAFVLVLRLHPHSCPTERKAQRYF